MDSEKFEVKHHDWKRTTRMTDIITLVNRARRDNEALHSTWNLQFCTIENNLLLGYIKATPDLSNIILVIVNMDPNGVQSGYIQLPKGRLKLGDHIYVRVRDLITEEEYTWTQEWNFISLDPFKMPFHLFKLEIGDPFQ
jgi:starch synthase (maltosyl-transferring)